LRALSSSFIGDSPLVIHNAAFDLKFLNAELERVDLPLIEASRAIDTVLIARKKFPGQPASLDALCKRFSIDTSKRNYHGALLDAQLLADVYLELHGGRQSALMLKNEVAEAEAQELGFRGHTSIPERQFPPSPEERAAHRALLEKIKQPIWKEIRGE